MYRARVGDYTVISGRTNLNNQATGQEVLVTGIYFPGPATAGSLQDPAGVGRFLLTLEEPLAGQPVKLLGPDEHSILKPGRRHRSKPDGAARSPGGTRLPEDAENGALNIQPPSVCRWPAWFQVFPGPPPGAR